MKQNPEKCKEVVSPVFGVSHNVENTNSVCGSLSTLHGYAVHVEAKLTEA